MSYIDGFVTPVPMANKEAYIDHVKRASDFFKDLGALRLVEAWGDEVPAGKVTDFQGAVKAKDDEAILFSWIEWPSKETRDAGMKKMMDDPRMKELEKEMPFDGRRMIYGGFSPIFDSQQA